MNKQSKQTEKFYRENNTTAFQFHSITPNDKIQQISEI